MSNSTSSATAAASSNNNSSSTAMTTMVMVSGNEKSNLLQHHHRLGADPIMYRKIFGTIFKPSTFLPPPSSKKRNTTKDAAAADDDAASSEFRTNNKTNNNNNGGMMAAYPPSDATTNVGDTTGACFALPKRLLPAFRHGKLRAFQEYCQSQSFLHFCSNSGLYSPRFTSNPHHAASLLLSTQQQQAPSSSSSSSELYERFYHALQTTVPDQSTLAIVFHGTSTANIPNILQYGLDPMKRSGQAYGPGEYFAKRPGISVSYCKGGRTMLVFCVVLPQPARLAEAAAAASSSSTTTTTTTQRTRSYQVPPPDYVVVEENSHQFPLGTLDFDGVDHEVMRQSNAMRQKLMALHREVMLQTCQAQELECKADIIQLMVKEQWDLCERKWKRSKDSLHEESKMEIAIYAHRKLQDDHTLVQCLFPDMPRPPKVGLERNTWWETEHSSDTVEAKQAQVESARQKLQAERQRLNREQQQRGPVLLQHPLPSPNNNNSAGGTATTSRLAELRRKRAQSALRSTTKRQALQMGTSIVPLPPSPPPPPPPPGVTVPYFPGTAGTPVPGTGAAPGADDGADGPGAVK